MAPPVCLRQISGMHLLVKLGHEVNVLIGSDKNAIADHTLSFISYSYICGIERVIIFIKNTKNS